MRFIPGAQTHFFLYLLFAGSELSDEEGILDEDTELSGISEVLEFSKGFVSASDAVPSKCFGPSLSNFSESSFVPFASVGLVLSGGGTVAIDPSSEDGTVAFDSSSEDFGASESSPPSGFAFG